MTKQIVAQLLLPVAVMTTLSACGTGGTLSVRSTDVDTALVLSADKRTILTANNPYRQGEKFRCAEPQPDAVRAVAQELASGIKGSGLISGVDAEVAASLGRRRTGIRG